MNLKFEGRKDLSIFVALPTHDGCFHAGFAISLVALSQKLGQAGISHQFAVLRGESLISRARNNLAADFLKSDCTHLLFLDTDLSFNPDMVTEMIAADQDVIGGTYPKKMLNGDAVKGLVQSSGEFDLHHGCKPVLNFKAGSAHVENGIVEVHDVGTGLMLIKRKVLEKMTRSRYVEKYVSNHDDSQGDKRWDFFPVKVHNENGNRILLSEDYMFCRNWQKMGGKIYAHVTYPVLHTGIMDYVWDIKKSGLVNREETEKANAAQKAGSKKRRR